MSAGSANSTVEIFVTDKAFVNLSTNSTNLFPTSVSNVAELSANALSYFVDPSVFTDKRTPASRDVNWVASTNPQLVVDKDGYPNFVTVMNAQSATPINSLFGLVDLLLFNYDVNWSHDTIENLLTTTTGMKDIYVPGSFSVSTLRVSDTAYTTATTPASVSVPGYAIFDIVLPSGSTTQTFTLKVYAGVQAWIEGYSRSVITEVVPPLSYARMYSESLGTASGNIFAVASETATLSYNSLQGDLKSFLVSGMMTYRAVLIDSNNEVGVPINILYKGRVPTLFAVRNAIKDALLTSGVGNEAGWKARMPGVFVLGRFYVVPLWDKTYQKPDQLIYPNILGYVAIKDKVETILGSLGYGDVSEYLDVFPLYYNHMTALALPDLTGENAPVHLSSIIPDYQSYSPTSEQFAYMQPVTQTFVREITNVMNIGLGTQVSTAYGPNTEGALTFYNFTAGEYEICVITKICYDTIVESEE